METVIYIVFLSLLYAMSIAVYTWLISYMLPKLFLGVRYEIGAHLGRGLRKIKYSDGRAVLYEPHPRVRKYMDKYLLFTVKGCKYFQFRVNELVGSYKLRVICYDNRNRVIDVIDVSETVESWLTRPVQLHQDTSYVAPLLLSVNGSTISDESVMVTGLRYAPLYLVSCAAATFLQFLHITTTFNTLALLLGGNNQIEMKYFLAVIGSALISTLCMLITLATRKKNGIKVVLK